ncbi:hypothetical protein [Chondromyces apiculatus]|uniref:Uncharacterized protein n=1 Tax=Chondromyces apiculatus DSM 436 TaxID=1192034 RepID=A0A017TB03_9BACT|nr:hypothetical protein [Chondromyces apiculatus]EYF05806.1 Hypothetical protein CAP_2807 [Chondromyces apiculatus DSM 436]
MAAEDQPDPRIAFIDNALAAWRQGDCALGQHWFVHRLDPAFALTDAGRVGDLLKEWLKLVPTMGRFESVEGQVVTLQDMNAGEYVDSDPLDLDHLSAGSGG